LGDEIHLFDNFTEYNMSSRLKTERGKFEKIDDEKIGLAGFLAS
jgi:hypothetical protein